MSFMSAVPAEKEAVNYFKALARKFPYASYILDGHSKGGNLAVYTSVFCKRSTQRKITCIYNYDGTGFKEHVLDHNRLEKWL